MSLRCTLVPALRVNGGSVCGPRGQHCAHIAAIRDSIFYMCLGQPSSFWRHGFARGKARQEDEDVTTSTIDPPTPQPLPDGIPSTRERGTLVRETPYILGFRFP